MGNSQIATACLPIPPPCLTQASTRGTRLIESAQSRLYSALLRCILPSVPLEYDGLHARRPFLPVLRHVGRSLFCGLVSQGCTGRDRACNAAALSELSAHSHRSVTGDKAVARITLVVRGGATCKRPKELGLLGLLRLRKVIELRTARNTQ